MPLDDLIPIGGAARSNAGSKRGGSSDLTSGLISISGARDNVDVDMTDFDVGDLLGDDSGKAKSKSKDKSDDKKKKKSKDKDKSKSSSSGKKKSKSKAKKSAFDNDDDVGDGGGAKNWDSAAELEMAAAAAARRKNGSGKTGGGLDDEFAKMLGLDSGVVGSGANFGSAESPPLSPEPVTGLNRNDDKVDDQTFGISGYTPTVRGSKKFDAPAPVEELSKAENEGISASFFQDDGKRDQDLSSLSSFLGPSTDRRGGGRGGRRQTGGADSDPFGFGSTAAPSSSTFDSLFGGASSRKSYLDDPFAKPPKDSLDPTQQDLKDPIEERKADQTRNDPPQDNFSARTSSPPTQRVHVSAKDDLLADLFSSEPRSSAQSDRRQEQLSFSTRDKVDDDDYDRKTKVEKSPEPTTPTVLPVAADPAKQQNDLLAELFATPSSSKTTAYEKPEDEDEAPKEKPAVVEINPTTPPKETTSLQEKAEARTASALPTENSNADLASARDSLLMDLLGGLSPPKPSEPLLSRRRSRSISNTNSNNNSPEKEVGKAPDPFKSSSPTQSQPLPTVPKVPVETPVAVVAASERPVTPPSPGRRRSLTMDKGSLAIRESDFEQSKDSLLEEILPSSPSVSARSSPHRLNSYSQSFEAEESVVAEEQGDEIVEEQETQVAADPPVPAVAPIVKSSLPPQAEPTVEPEVQVPTPQPQPIKSTDHHEPQVVLAPACNCVEREAKITAAFDVERAALQQKINELMQQLETQAASSNQLTQQLTQQLEEREASIDQLSQQLEARGAANAQLAQQFASAERDKLEAHQAAATSKDDAASFQHRAELLEAELRSLREELSRSKRAVLDAELALARGIAEQDEVDQLERHREKRALEALSAQMQRALARLTISHQVQEEGSGYDNSAARVAAEDEARLRVIASLEGSSKRAAQHAEQERTKLAELLRELEAGARNARQGALEDKERLRQEQQRLDALSAHLQAQAAALRDQEAAHAAYMGKQLAEAREDARVYEARLATRRTQLERDERALYEARAEFAAFREQTALEIEREHEELRKSRLALEVAWRELRADREDLEAELASHEDEFQALENMRQEVQQAETRLAERTQDVVALAEKLDAGTRELLAREQLVAQQAAVVQDTDTSFSSRERALERVKHELETREQRLHVQIRQLDSVRMRLTQQRREQQQLMTAARRNCTTEKPTKVVVDNNKPWRQAVAAPHSSNSSYSPLPQSWETEQPIEEEDPSGLPPALRKQVEANWLRRNQQVGQYRQSSSRKLDFHDFAAESSSWSSKTLDLDTPSYINKSSNVKSAAKLNNVSRQGTSAPVSHNSVDSFKAHQQQRSNSPATSFHTGSRPPPPPMRSPGAFQPTLRVNL